MIGRILPDDFDGDRVTVGPAITAGYHFVFAVRESLVVNNPTKANAIRIEAVSHAPHSEN